MPKLCLVFFLLLSVAAMAQPPWKQNGEVWSAGGLTLTIPSALKAKADSHNVLGAEGNSISMTFQLLPKDQDFKSFTAASMKKLETFKNIRWSEPQFGQEGDMALSLRLGRYKAKDLSLEFALSMFQKGQLKLATMTVQVADHKPSSQVISGVINSIKLP